MAKALGKGLGALIKTYNSNVKKTSENYNLDITKIVPNSNQPRQEFNKKSMVDLIESINEKGILQPLAVRKISDDSYELIIPFVGQVSKGYELYVARNDAGVLEQRIREEDLDYSGKRRNEYPSIDECIHAILDDDLENLQAKRTAIKNQGK